jgi:hypothetical protein
MEATIPLLWDSLNTLTDPLPDPIGYPNIDWDAIVREILQRCTAVCNAIRRHSTLPDGAWLRLGSNGGLFCTLRLVEFANRVIALKAPKNFHEPHIERARFSLQLVLPKEMWRRWAFASMPDNHKDAPRADLFTCWQIYMGCVMMNDGLRGNEV